MDLRLFGRRIVDDYRSLTDLGWNERARFRQARRSAAYQQAYDKPEPLVSIVTATYNRAELLIDRCVRSALAQTYRNIELIVVGDGCDDDTAKRMAEVTDPRVRFVNLDRRETYPDDPTQRWELAGAKAINTAFKMAQGDFISQLDDDDEYTPERIAVLVDFLKATRADYVYHAFRHQHPEGWWFVHDAAPRHGCITNSATIYHRWFLNHPIVSSSLIRWREPGDWNRFRKFRFLGADMRANAEPMTLHYRERARSDTANVTVCPS